MPRRREAGSLLAQCLGRLASLAKDWVLVAADRVFQAGKAGERDGGHGPGYDQYTEVRRLTARAAEDMAAWIFSHVVRSLRSEVTLALLQGLDRAIEMSKDVSQHRQVYIVVAFSDLVVSPHLQALDLTTVPKILRLHFYDKLGSFRGLHSLLLGSGSGGWSDCYREKFTAGIGKMRCLVRFSLCYDCTDRMVELLAANCSATLRVLDVEMSSQVTDVSVEAVSCCQQLTALHLHHTGLSTAGQAALLLALPRLQLLVRGGFLCEVLELLVDREPTLSLGLLEFWSSEDYFFHSDRQMQLVSRMCPRMQKITFQFSPDAMSDLLVLATFPRLTELHLWGGDWTADRIHELLDRIGPQLTGLHLVHTERLDRSALQLVARRCPHLAALGLHHCELQDQGPGLVEEVWQEPEGKDKLAELPELRQLAVVSECRAGTLLLLLAAAPNLRHLKTGLNCQLSDSLFMEVFRQNQLQHLETLHIPASNVLSSVTLQLFLDGCPHLASIQDLNYWEAIPPLELAQVRAWLEEGNYRLDAGASVREPEVQKHLDDLPASVINYLMG